MPYTADARFNINGRTSGKWTIPCDGGATILTATASIKLGWTATEVGPPPTTGTLQIDLVDDDPIFPDRYASETVNVSSGDAAVAAPVSPGIIIGPPPTKWTQYTVTFQVFCAKYGCLVCARDSAGIVGSQGESSITLLARYTLGTNSPSFSAARVTVQCDQSATGAVHTAAILVNPPEYYAATLPPSTAELAVLIGRIVDARIRDALAKSIGAYLPLGETETKAPKKRRRARTTNA